MSLGTISQANRDGHVFTNALSNDIIFTTKTLDQRMLFGFSSNFPTAISVGKSNIVYGSDESNVNVKQWGGLDVDKNIFGSNVFVRNKLGVGSNVTMVDPAITLYVDGTARVQGDLIVNGNIEAIDTNVTVTDEFLVVNNGTGAALQVVQNGVTPVVGFSQSNDTKMLLLADGRLLVGSNVSSPQVPYDGIRLFVQGGMSVSNIRTVDISTSNVYTQDLYMDNKLVIDKTGIITNSNFIPTLDTSKIKFGTFTSNFIENYNIISQKLASNLTIAGRTNMDGYLGINTPLPDEENAEIRLKVKGGDIMITGPNDFKQTGDQARIYFGSNSSYFIGAACNVGLVMQVPNTIYPMVMEENTGFVGLGTMDPEERLHVGDNAKINNRLHVASNISIGGSSNPSATLAIMGNMSFSNTNTYVTLWTSNENLGLNTSNPVARLHIRQHNPDASGDIFYAQGANQQSSFVVKPSGNTGIGVFNPSEALDVSLNAKVGSNIYVMSRIGVAKSNPSFPLDIAGDMRVRSSVYVDDNGSIVLMDRNAKAPASAYWMLTSFSGCNYVGLKRCDSNYNMLISDQGFIRVGDSVKRADERLHVSHGHLKVDCNLYVLGQTSMGNSNPTETLDVTGGNAKFQSNVYIMSRLGVGMSNPLYAIDVLGDINLSGVIKQGAGNATFGSNVTILNNLGIGTEQPTESLQVANGNADFKSNVFIGTFLGVGTSNPEERIDVQRGNIKVSSNIYILNKLGVGTSNPQVTVDIRGSDAVLIPLGTTQQRPAVPALGYIRYNTSYQTFEGFGAGSAWGSLGGVKDTNQDTYISPESFPTSNDDILRFYNSNFETMTMASSNIIVRAQQTIYSNSNAAQCVVGINNSNPTAALDIIGNLRIANTLQTSNERLGIKTNDPKFSVHVATTDAILIPTGNISQRPDNPLEGCIRYNTTYQTFEGFGAGSAWGSLGGVKDTNQDTYISPESFPTSNDDILRFYNSNFETMTMASSNIIVRAQQTIYSNSNAAQCVVGINNSNPTAALDIIGNLKIANTLQTSNERLGIKTNDPKFSVHVATTDAILIPTGNISQRPDNPLEGCIRYNTTYQTFEGFGAGSAWGSLGGVKDTNQDTFVSAETFATSNDDTLRFVNSNQETMRIMPSGYLGLSNIDPSERLELSFGNAKFNSNIYVMQRLGVGLSNPLQSVHVNGNIRAANGCLGPMIMLIPPFAYADVDIGSRLVLDNTLEAGNESGSNVLFYGNGFLHLDTSDDNMQWKQARLIFRGTAQTNIDMELHTMVVQEWVDGSYTSISTDFNIMSRKLQRGYLTNTSPWFEMSTNNERHLAILLQSSTLSSTYRFGSVYLQFRA
jgi:hypothetical protein